MTLTINVPAGGTDSDRSASHDGDRRSGDRGFQSLYQDGQARGSGRSSTLGNLDGMTFPVESFDALASVEVCCPHQMPLVLIQESTCLLDQLALYNAGRTARIRRPVSQRRPRLKSYRSSRGMAAVDDDAESGRKGRTSPCQIRVGDVFMVWSQVSSTTVAPGEDDYWVEAQAGFRHGSARCGCVFSSFWQFSSFESPLAHIDTPTFSCALQRRRV